MSSEQAATAIHGLAEPADESAAALVEDLRCLRVLLEEGNVEGARRLIADMAPRWPDSAEVQHFARVLAPPRTSVARGKPSRNLDREVAWLRQHAHEYPGQWVAVYEDRLIAADPSFSAVRAAVRQTPNAAGALLHRCPTRQS
jgi:hypothetical protein